MKKIMEMLPFKIKIPQDMLELQEDKIKKFKVIINSMTPEEKEDPEIIKSSRVERIARGSGTKPEEVRELLNYYKNMKKMMKSMGGERKLNRMMRKFGGLGM